MKLKVNWGVFDMKWHTYEDLQNLICEVVGWDSRTGTEGEIQFAYNLKEKLLELDYFQSNPSHIELHDAGQDRNAVTALYKSEETNKTIVLISHFDTVHTDEFGEIEELAYKPLELTKELKKE